MTGRGYNRQVRRKKGKHNKFPPSAEIKIIPPKSLRLICLHKNLSIGLVRFLKQNNFGERAFRNFGQSRGTSRVIRLRKDIIAGSFVGRVVMTLITLFTRGLLSSFLLLLS